MHPESIETLVQGLPDAELTRRIAAGDDKAFRLPMRRCTLYRTAQCVLREDCEAEDVVQEAFLSAYRVIGTFRGDSKLSTWLVRRIYRLGAKLSVKRRMIGSTAAPRNRGRELRRG